MNIVFVKTGSHSLFGSFSAGDTMRCDEQLANQLITAGFAENASVSEAESFVVDSDEGNTEGEQIEDSQLEEAENEIEPEISHD